MNCNAPNCSNPLPPGFKKYCSRECNIRAFNARKTYQEKKIELTDQSIDTFGFLTRKGLAQSVLGA